VKHAARSIGRRALPSKAGRFHRKSGESVENPPDLGKIGRESVYWRANPSTRGRIRRLAGESSTCPASSRTAWAIPTKGRRFVELPRDSSRDHADPGEIERIVATRCAEDDAARSSSLGRGTV
jgi:hypothetical protein